jgi:hypothetical protein
LPELEFFVGAETKPRADARAAVSGTWGPLRVLTQSKGCVSTEGGKIWLCPVEVVAGETRTYFVLTLRFEQPVPPLEQWP